jgi:hypothetical protein
LTVAYQIRRGNGVIKASGKLRQRRNLFAKAKIFAFELFA